MHPVAPHLIPKPLHEEEKAGPDALRLVLVAENSNGRGEAEAQYFNILEIHQPARELVVSVTGRR